jgi:hypothetical protein
MANGLFNAPLEFLDDFHGNKSSKRFWGNRLLTMGVLLACCLYVCHLISPLLFDKGVPDSIHNNAYEIVKLFFYTGGGLLFGGVFENKWPKK